MKLRKKSVFVWLGAIAAIVFAVLLAAGLSSAPQEQTFAAETQTCAAESAAFEAEDALPAADETTDPAAEEGASEPAAEQSADGWKALAAGIAIGLAAGAGAAGMGVAIAKTSEAIARQPEAEGKIRSTLMLGLVFIETAIIYALIVAILVIFVL